MSERSILERLDEESSRWDLHNIYAIRDTMIDAAAEIRRLQAVEAAHANLRQVHDALSRRESGLYNEIIAIAKEVGHPDPEACDLGSVLSLIRERKAVQPQSTTATNPSASGHNRGTTPIDRAASDRAGHRLVVPFAIASPVQQRPFIPPFVRPRQPSYPCDHLDEPITLPWEPAAKEPL